MLKKCVISNNILTVLKLHGKSALADVNCYCKMISVVVLDGVTSFLRLKDATYLCKLCHTVQLFEGFLQCHDGKLEKAEDLKCVFVVYCVLELS